MKRVLSLAAAALLASATLPAMAQTTVEGGASGQGSTVIQPGSSGATGGASGSASGSATVGTTDTTTTGSINLSAEQQTEMRTLLSEGAAPADVDVELSIGAMVPDTVEVRPLPPRFVEIVPQYEGYRYFVLADGRIVIVEPDTLEVVYIMS